MRHNLNFPKNVEARIDNYRAKKRPIPDFTDAVVYLVEVGLTREEEDQE